MGNHDRSAGSLASIGWEVYKEPLVLYHEVGWWDDLVATYPSHIILSHYPLYGVIEEGTDVDTQHMNVAVNGWNYYPVPLPMMRGWLAIHGHSHNGRLHSPIHNRRPLR